MTTPVDCLIEASAALTRYRTLTKGQRPPVDDLTLYEWLTSFVPERSTTDTAEQVMRKVIKSNVYLWDPCARTTQYMLDGEIERVFELLDDMGYPYKGDES